MDSAVGPSGGFLNPLDGPVIAFRQACVYAGCNLSQRLRDLLPSPSAIILDLLYHILRRHEAVIRHIHAGWKVAFPGRLGTDLGKAVLVIQIVPYRLDHPQSHDITQIADLGTIPAFIGETVDST